MGPMVERGTGEIYERHRERKEAWQLAEAVPSGMPDSDGEALMCGRRLDGSRHTMMSPPAVGW